MKVSKETAEFENIQILSCTMQWVIMFLSVSGMVQHG